MSPKKSKTSKTENDKAKKATEAATAPENPSTKATPTKAPKAEPKAKKVSALDAAAKVLGEQGKPMTSQEMIEEMSRKKYWTSPNGATPQATLYAAIMREIKVKGKDARFVKTERASAHHCHTLPCMSHNPNLFGG